MSNAQQTPWIRNAWYVACQAAEVDGGPLGRQICGRRMVFFRPRPGEIAAMEDYCPHRGAPLSLGFVENETLVCGYHGLAVGCTGKVASMPAQRVASFPSVPVYPVVERFGFIWVWPGDPERARLDALPSFVWADNPTWAYAGGVYHIKCDYRLMIDNLMDLTHETYVHQTSVGQKEIDEAAPDTHVNGDEVITTRLMERIIAPPLWKRGLRDAGLPEDEPVDRWQICKFSPPSHVIIDVGVAVAGKGGPNAESRFKVNSYVIDFITPETEHTHWYFWGSASQRDVGRAEQIAARKDAQGQVFAEDREVLERQQQSLLAFPRRDVLRLNIDAGGVHARKIIERWKKLESASEGA